MLVIKDKYSKKLFRYALTSKSLTNVYQTIKRFEKQVKRQYRLSICILKHDNKQAVITINNKTTYKLQAKEEKIKLKLSLTYTHETNKSAEQAGQEAITKSIKMHIVAEILDTGGFFTGLSLALGVRTDQRV